MPSWNAPISIAVGGLLAVAILDECRIIVGSHSGLGVFEASTGERLERVRDDAYRWFQEDPPSIKYPGPNGLVLVRAAGLWGGELDRQTADGWTCRLVPGGAVVSRLGHEDLDQIVINDKNDLRACGFSPEGRVFVYATSPSLSVMAR